MASNNTRRHRSRPNHLRAVSRGAEAGGEPAESAAGPGVAVEDTPLAITGRSRVVLDPEEYQRLQDAAERAAQAPPERSDARADSPPQPSAIDTPELPVSDGAEPLGPFIANLNDQGSSAALAGAGGREEPLDVDPFEEFARLRPQTAPVTPRRAGSAALPTAHTRRGRAGRGRVWISGRGALRRLGWRWPAAALLAVAALVSIAVLAGGGPRPQQPRPSTAQPVGHVESLENLMAAYIARTRAAEATRAERAAHARELARARQARAAARARRRRLERRRAEAPARPATRHSAAPTTTTATDTVTVTDSTPATSPAGSQATAASSSGSGGTGSGSAGPAGPTGVASYSVGCDPKCN